MKSRVGIKDIALRAGVSKGTVDRVIHDRGNVSPAAKTKVLEAMKDLDYQPNLIASALASRKVTRVAVLIPDSKNDPFWQQPRDGILKAKKSLQDYRVVIDFYYFRDADGAHFLEQGEQILKGAYEAVLVSPSFSKESQIILKKFEDQGLSYIQINTFMDQPSEQFLAYIGQDSYASGMLAAKLLDFGMSAGASAMILHLEKDAYNAKHLVDKETGFNDFFSIKKNYNIPIVRAGFGDVFNKNELRQYLQDQFDQHPDIQGIFVTTSKVFHIVPILEELGKTNVKLVGFDLIRENLDYLQTDQIHFLINQNPQKQGFLGMMNLFNYLILKKEIQHIQHLPLDVVMKENVSYYLEEKSKELHLVF